MKTAQINEIFDSIQGEGPYIGYRQLFIRFCGCNINCAYCDTEFKTGTIYTTDELIKKVKTYDLKTIHSISLTGGEPLIHFEFLKEFLPLTGCKVYLETNGTMAHALEEVIHNIDIISMDIKLDSSSKIGDIFLQHEKFIETVVKYRKEIFAKIVFDTDIRDFEINESVRLAQKYEMPLILQPRMEGNNIAVPPDFIEETMKKFTARYKDTRLIGQVHKFFNIR